MNCVPTDGPEIDLCRGGQLVWFDAGELDAMPHRSPESIAGERRAERRAAEQREWQRHRDEHIHFMTWILRHPTGLLR
jgi:Zn-finger nucleic acid-binding protein